MVRHILHSHRDGVDILPPNRPPANAMDIALLEELRNAFSALAGNDSAHAIVLTAGGSTFCAGLDVKAVPQ